MSTQTRVHKTYTKRRKIMDNRQLTHVWAHGQSGKGSNLYSDGTTLKSYSTDIATKIDNIIYISSNNMSCTTSKHISYARQAVGCLNPSVFMTSAFSRRGSDPRHTHEAMIMPCVREAEQTLKYALENTRTRKSTKIAAISRYNQEKKRIQAHARRVGVTLPAMMEIEANPDELERYAVLKTEKEARELEARVKAQKKQQRLDKKQYVLWLTTGAGRCPNSFMVRGSDQITIKGDYVTYKNQKDYPEQPINQPVIKVVTSQGAECPLDHAIKALKFWESRRVISTASELRKFKSNVYEPYHTNGHVIHLGVFTLDSIDEAGTVKAGCHTFTAKEIQRFINQWREVLGL
jgi:hypothetical protein